MAGSSITTASHSGHSKLLPGPDIPSPEPVPAPAMQASKNGFILESYHKGEEIKDNKYRISTVIIIKTVLRKKQQSISAIEDNEYVQSMVTYRFGQMKGKQDRRNKKQHRCH